MNLIVLSGNITKDIIVNQTSAGKPVCNFSIAVNRKYKTQDGEKITDFFDCTAFGKTADFLGQYLEKGCKVIVTGSMNLDTYINKEGQTVYKYYVMVENIEPVTFKKTERAEESVNQVSTPVSTPTTSVAKEDPFSQFQQQLEVDDDYLE